jgi:hypothetical protein
MRYVDKTFTFGTSNGQLTDEEYEIAVGLRPPKTKQETKEEKPCTSRSQSQ